MPFRRSVGNSTLIRQKNTISSSRTATPVETSALEAGFAKKRRRGESNSPLLRASAISIILLLLTMMAAATMGRRAAAFSFSSMTSRPLRPSSRRPSTTLAAATASAAAAAGAPASVHDSSSAAQHHVELKHVEFSTSQGTGSSSPPVLLLHGLLGNKRNFATVAQSLSAQLERKRRIFGLDLRNHGENHHDWRDHMGYREMAGDVLAFMDRHNMEKSVLVGHSMGGKVAQAAALIDPDRVDGLVVLDIAPVKYEDHEPHWKAVSDIVTALRSVPVDGEKKLSKQDLDRTLRPVIPDPAVRAFCQTNWDARTGKWKIHLDAIVSQLETLAGFDIHHSDDGVDANGDPKSGDQQRQPRQYHGDAFFIHGGQSRFVRHSYLNTISEYFPNHLLTTVKGAGHWIHAEAPDDTTALLKKYLDR